MLPCHDRQPLTVIGVQAAYVLVSSPNCAQFAMHVHKSSAVRSITTRPAAQSILSQHA